MTTENLYVIKGISIQEKPLTERSDYFFTSLYFVVFLSILYVFAIGQGTIISNGRIRDYSLYMISTEEALSDIIYAKFEKKSSRGSLDKVILKFHDSKEIKIYYNIELLFEILEKHHVFVEGR